MSLSVRNSLTTADNDVNSKPTGTHPELSSLMQEIEQKREQRLVVADMGKKHKTDIAQHQYDVTEYQAHCTFQVNIEAEYVFPEGNGLSWRRYLLTLSTIFLYSS